MLPDNVSGLQPPKAGPQVKMPAGEEQGSRPGQVQASPQEQAAYEAFVAQASMTIFDPKGSERFIEAMRQSNDPRAAVAGVTAGIVDLVARSAKQAGRTLPPDIILAGLDEISSDVMELADAAGVYRFSEDVKATQAAAIRAYGETQAKLVQSGLIPQEFAQEGVAELKALEKRGLLKDALRTPSKFAMPAEGAPAQEAKPMSRQQRRRARKKGLL